MERHPQNQLPYIDSLKVLGKLPDEAAALEMLRTGKVDVITMFRRRKRRK